MGFFCKRIIFLSVLAVIGSIVGFFASFSYVFAIMNSFRHYFLFILILGVLICFFMKKRVYLLIFSSFFLLNAGMIFNTAFMQGEQGKAKISILSSNILVNNLSLDKVSSIIRQRDPDVLVVMELTRESYQALRLKEAYPYEVVFLRGDCFGIGLFSRFKPESSSIAFTPEHLPYVCAKIKGFNIAAVHPIHPSSKAFFIDRMQLFRQIPKKKNQVVIGDFNAVPWSPVLAEIRKRCDMKDVRSGFRTLVPSWGRFPFWLSLDGCLVSQNIHVNAFEFVSIPGADHKAVYVSLNTAM